MKALGNVLWHVPFLGFLSAIITYLVGAILSATVIAAPIGLGLMEHGKFLFAPFSYAVVDKSELNVAQNKAWKTYSTIVTILYLPFGIILCAIAILQIFGLFISILGIPVAIVVAKSLGTYLNPVNKQCVPQAVADELERRKGAAQVSEHLSASRRISEDAKDAD